MNIIKSLALSLLLAGQSYASTIEVDLDRCVLFFEGKAFAVSVGKIVDRHSVTPDGTFEVTGKSLYPPCKIPGMEAGPFNKDPKNPYGKYFIGTTGKRSDGKGIGLHGTNKDTEIGKRKYISSGCIRMKNESLDEIFDKIRVGDKLLITRNTPKEVVEVPAPKPYFMLTRFGAITNGALK